MAQVVKCLPSMHEALGSTSSMQKKESLYLPQLVANVDMLNYTFVT
jgi:hypothetical protein